MDIALQKCYVLLLLLPWQVCIRISTESSSAVLLTCLVVFARSSEEGVSVHVFC